MWSHQIIKYKSGDQSCHLVARFKNASVAKTRFENASWQTPATSSTCFWHPNANLGPKSPPQAHSKMVLFLWKRYCKDCVVVILPPQLALLDYNIVVEKKLVPELTLSTFKLWSSWCVLASYLASIHAIKYNGLKHMFTYEEEHQKKNNIF